MAEIKEQKTINQLLQEIRYEMSKTELKKSGYNAYGKFNYFELKDFVPKATELFTERGLCPIFNIAVIQGIEYAVLTITRGPETIEFRIPTADSNNSSNPIQNLGAKITYLRRYLYLICLDLVENDIIDATSGKDEKKVNFATKFQVDKLSQNKELLIDKFKEMNIKTINDIKALTTEQASELIEILESRNEGRVSGE